MNSRVTIIIPVFNEELNIENVIKNVINHANQIVIVDDCSTDKSFEIINLGCGEPVELMQFINLIEKELGKEAKKNFLPLQPGDVPATMADISKAQRLLNYKPLVTVAEGIPNFIDWYKKFYV